MMNREAVIEYIKKHSPAHSEMDFSKHTDAELILLQLNIDFDKKREMIRKTEKNKPKK